MLRPSVALTTELDLSSQPKDGQARSRTPPRSTLAIENARRRLPLLAHFGLDAMSDLSPQGDAKRTLASLGYQSCASALVLYVSLNDVSQALTRAEA